MPPPDSDPPGWRPIPDPTTLTNELVSKATAALREIIETRLDANDKAVTLLQIWRDSVPVSIRREVAHLREVQDAKFASIINSSALFKESVNDRFALNAGQVERAARDAKAAVDNAFLAAKEAVSEQNKSFTLSIAKSDAATAEAIRQGQQLFQNAIGSLTIQVNDLKSRLDKGEGSRTVSDPATETRLASLTATIAGLSRESDRGHGIEKQKSDNGAMILAVVAIIIAGLGTLAALAHIFVVK